jgi:hypothetical protein
MPLLGKYIFFTRHKVRKNIFAKLLFTYFEVTFYPIIFCKNNPRFFCNYKSTLLLALKFFKSFT